MIDAKRILKLYKMGGTPIPLNGKIPNGFEECELKFYYENRPTIEVIQTWIDKGLYKNVGLMLGKLHGNIVCFDFDYGDKKKWEVFGFNPTSLVNEGYWVQKTPGGDGRYHIFLRFNKEVDINRETCDKVEYRGNNHYMVLYPSIHPSGRKYELLNDFDTLELPIECDADKIWEDIKRKCIEKGFVKQESEINFIPQVITREDIEQGLSKGNRKSSLMKYAGMHRKEFSDDEIECMLFEVNEKNKPPLEKEEVLDVSKSSRKYRQQEMQEKKQLEDEAIIELKNPELLLNIIKDVQNKGVEGEENTIITLINKICLRLVNNAKPTSSNIIVSDATGGGKDWITEKVCNVMLPKAVYYHRTDISQKSFDYWKPVVGWEKNKEGKNEPIYGSWDGRVIHLEDPSKELLSSQSFKVRASGQNYVTKVIDGKIKEIEIFGKPVFIVTSLKTSVDEEGCRRWDMLRLDTSENQTNAITNNILLSASGEINVTCNERLQYGLHEMLNSYEVIVPFACKIGDYLPSTIVMRTQASKLIDFIKASTVLHQYQRKQDEKGMLIATWDDYSYGLFVFEHLSSVIGKPLNVKEEMVLKCLQDADKPLKVKKIAEESNGCSKSWLYDNAENLVDKGIITISFTPNDFGGEIQVWSPAILNDEKDILPSATRLSDEKINWFSKIKNIIDFKRIDVGLKPLFGVSQLSHLEDFMQDGEYEYSFLIKEFDRGFILNEIEKGNLIKKSNDPETYVYNCSVITSDIPNEKHDKPKLKTNENK